MKRAGMDRRDVPTKSADSPDYTAPTMTRSGIFKRAEPAQTRSSLRPEETRDRPQGCSKGHRNKDLIQPLPACRSCPLHWCGWVLF